MGSRVKEWLKQTPAGSAYRAHKRARRMLRNRGKLQQRMAFLDRLVSAGDLCFDVGANFGQTTVPLAMLGARVVALEPGPEALQVLRLTTRRLEEVVVLPVAAGARPARGSLFTHAETALSSMSMEWIDGMKRADLIRQDGWQKPIAVDVVTLDSLVEEYGLPAFVKVDAEGYELEILQGLSSLPRTLLIEHSPPTTDRTFACLDRIASFGAAVRINYTRANENHFVMDSWIDIDAFRELLADLECVVDLVVTCAAAASPSSRISPSQEDA